MVGTGDSALADGVSESEAVVVGPDEESGEDEGSDGESVAGGGDAESGEADGVSMPIGVPVAGALELTGVGLWLGSGVDVTVGSPGVVSVSAAGGGEGDGSALSASVLTGDWVAAASMTSVDVAESTESWKGG